MHYKSKTIIHYTILSSLFILLQARQITLPPTNSIPFVKKTETSHNICGTPSSSPVETNHGNKNPILRPKSPSGGLLRHPDDFSDDSLNHSDDEAILTECIQSAMPKVIISQFFITITLKENIPFMQNVIYQL